MKLRAIPFVGVVCIACVGLIGTGVHATFTTSTASGQTITAGIPGDPLTGLCVSGTNCPVDPSNSLYSVSANGSTLTFAPDTPSGPSFTTGDEGVTATSTGNIPLTNPTWVLNASGGTQLMGEAYVCVTSTGIGSNNSNVVLYNGPLSAMIGTSYALSGDELVTSGTPTATSGPTDSLVVDVYAGSETTLCGTTTAANSAVTPGLSTAPTLSGDSAGQVIAVSVTMTYQD